MWDLNILTKLPKISLIIWRQPGTFIWKKWSNSRLRVVWCAGCRYGPQTSFLPDFSSFYVYNVEWCRVINQAKMDLKCLWKSFIYGIIKRVVFNFDCEIDDLWLGGLQLKSCQSNIVICKHCEVVCNLDVFIWKAGNWTLCGSLWLRCSQSKSWKLKIWTFWGGLRLGWSQLKSRKLNIAG